jgi:Tetratricopeptide repeat
VRVTRLLATLLVALAVEPVQAQSIWIHSGVPWGGPFPHKTIVIAPAFGPPVRVVPVRTIAIIPTGLSPFGLPILANPAPVIVNPVTPVAQPIWGSPQLGQVDDNEIQQALELIRRARAEVEKPPLIPGPERPAVVRPALPGMPPAPLEARAEHALQMTAGIDAIAQGTFARAERRFHDAIAADPSQPMPYFLLAEACVALGKYQESMQAIEEGMRSWPLWPLARFQPAQLFDPARGAYVEQMQRLMEAQARHPDEASLNFLVAYHLWFDGHKDQAVAWFKTALAKGATPTVVDRFLHPLPLPPLIF